MNPSFKLITGAFAALALAASALATPILVGVAESDNSGENSENLIMRGLIDTYNAANNPDLPLLFGSGATPSLLAGWIGFPKDETQGSDEIVWTAPWTYAEYYLLTKWGQGGAAFDTALHYILAGQTLTYNPGGAGAPNGLSHLRLFARGTTSVPDGASTAALLGLGLVGLSFIARRRKV
jgi:hypothetical protein